jgi:hypothetical protein
MHLSWIYASKSAPELPEGQLRLQLAPFLFPLNNEQVAGIECRATLKKSEIDILPFSVYISNPQPGNI